MNRFLQDYKTDSKGSIVSLIHPKGKFIVPEENIEKFWNLYCDCYIDETLGLAECHNFAHIPVLVDVDIKREGDIQEPLYSLKQVQRLVHIYQKVLREILDDVSSENLYCFLLEKPAYIIKKSDKKYTKNGFHLHFPFLFMSRYDQEYHLLPRIKIECKKLSPSEIPQDVSIDNYVDKGYLKSTWLLYGSRKDELQPTYLVTGVFEDSGEVNHEWKNFLYNYKLSINDQFVSLDNYNIDYYLPRIFSIVPRGREEYIKNVHDNLELVSNHIPGIIKTKKQTNAKFRDDTDDIETKAEKLLNILNKERVENYNDWIMVGWTLFNVFDGSEIGYDLWVKFSRKSPSKFDESVCYHTWNSMIKKDLTLGTLKYMAKCDNPEKYKEVSKEFVKPWLEKCMKLDGTHNDLAKALFQRYEGEFVCSSITKNIWYQFTNHCWKRDEEGNTLRKKISDEFVYEYELIANDYIKKMSTVDSEEESKMYKSKLNNVVKLIRNLKSSPYKTNIMKEANEVFFNEEFHKKLDANPYLIGFANGIYDFEHFIFRPGNPQDYVSIKMNINYIHDLTMENPIVQDVISYFTKIFPDETVREYFLHISCDIFIGGNRNKIVQVWSGEGNNGKSITQQLFEKMLGPYNIKLPTSLIVGKRTQSSSACPELARAGNGVRFAMLQEPDEKDVINVGILKELSGNDTFYARGLYKEGTEITPMFKLALICNKTPKLPNADKAAWNRIKVIPFESTFKEEAPDTLEEQLATKIFPMDKQFCDKIPKMIEPLAWYLIERLKTKPMIIETPPKVMYATQSYQKSNDIYQQFIDELIIDNPDGFVLLNDLYVAYKDWFRESIPNGVLATKLEICEQFNKVWGVGESIGNSFRWNGRSIRNDFTINI